MKICGEICGSDSRRGTQTKLPVVGGGLGTWAKEKLVEKFL